MTQNRTHTCNELRMEHAGQKVKLSGWMENVREVGQNFAFVILRDFYGTTQVVIETEEMMDIIHGLNKESTISVEGTVRERSSKNTNLPTGEIEVVPEKIEVLGRCQFNELPFQVGRSREARPALTGKGNVYGTYIHGIFDAPNVADEVLKALCRRKGADFARLGAFDAASYRERQYDLLADAVRASLDMDLVYRSMGVGRR